MVLLYWLIDCYLTASKQHGIYVHDGNKLTNNKSYRLKGGTRMVIWKIVFIVQMGEGDECHQIILHCNGPPTTIMCYCKLSLMYLDHGILWTRDTHLEPVLRSSCVLGFPHRNKIRFYTRSYGVYKYLCVW